ncbi:MAG: nucleoside transporter [Phycisphaerales bacterium]|jgi:concentrative nucleoside transporter, CNT family|nr:nucleoside transporter [Phycisphaerales bacterium]MBT7171367.1 nucleoside transporter [Phycisphaerales bacterium]
MTHLNLISGLGLVAFVFIAWALSSNRRNVNVRVVVWGVGLQLLLAGVLFHSSLCRDAMLHVNTAVVGLLQSATGAMTFVFGRLGENPDGTKFILATQALPLMIIFSAVMALLYHAGILPWIIRQMAKVFTRLMRISGAESLCVSGSVFVGVEGTMMAGPTFKTMTRSELCMLFTTYMATIASTVFAVYVGFLSNVFPNIAGHLITASLLSAPAAVVMAKLLCPEDETPDTLGMDVRPVVDKADNAIVAFIDGAHQGLRLCVNVAVLLLAVLGLLYMVDYCLGGAMGLCGVEGFGLKTLLGWVFYPFAWLLGVESGDVQWVGQLLGERAVATEIPSYIALSKAIGDPATTVSPRTAVIAAYALCGFAHIPATAITMGAFVGLAPERRGEFSRLAPRALLAATLACLMTGAVAGLMYTGGETLLTVAK